MRATQTTGTTSPGPQSLRHSVGGWALRLRFQRSVLRRGLCVAVWGQPEGLRNSAPQAGEPSTSAERTKEEVQTCRRSRVTL